MRKFLNTVGEPFRRFANAPLKTVLPILAAIAFVLTTFLEISCRESVVETARFILKNPIAFISGIAIVLFSLSLCLFVKRRLALLSAITLLWIAIGVTSAVVMSIRSAPLSAIDFLVMQDALGVAGAYFSTFEIILIAVLITLAIAAIVLLFIKAPKGAVKYIRSLISFVAIGACTLTLILTVSAMSPKSENLINSYNRNGFVYCFSRSIFVHGVERPDDDAINKKDEFMDKLDDKDTQANTGPFSSPNIVVIQLESFFDVKHITDVEFSKDPTPNYTALKQNGISGFLNVAHIGGGTANVEFEFLTGMNLDHFGLGEFPYTTVLKSRACESLATNLKALDYTSHAIHNHTATFYGRNTVYPYLGFDTFTPLELMTNVERNILTFATDDVLVDEIKYALDSTGTQDFVFAVSVEGHGGYPDYPLEWYYTEDDVEVYGIEDSKAYCQYRFYTKLINEMDETVGQICELMEERGEPYVLVFYGDHLPSLPIEESQLENGSLYQTEYVIKTNLDLCGFSGVSDINELDRDLETYQLSAYIQQLCGMSQGQITRLHQHEFETGETYDDILQTIEYEQLYSDNVQYEPAEMVIGTHLPLFEHYELSGNTLYVYGIDFNQYSTVKIDGVRRDTSYIDEFTLMVENVIFDIDEIEVVQVADDGTELAKAIVLQ